MAASELPEAKVPMASEMGATGKLGLFTLIQWNNLALFLRITSRLSKASRLCSALLNFLRMTLVQRDSQFEIGQNLQAWLNWGSPFHTQGGEKEHTHTHPLSALLTISDKIVTVCKFFWGN